MCNTVSMKTREIVGTLRCSGAKCAHKRDVSLTIFPHYGTVPKEKRGMQATTDHVVAKVTRPEWAYKEGNFKPLCKLCHDQRTLGQNLCHKNSGSYQFEDAETEAIRKIVE